MTACLRIEDLQCYLVDTEAVALKQTVESHLPLCQRCRALLERVTATTRRVDAWLSELAAPLEAAPIDAAAGMSRVLSRIAQPTFVLSPDTPWYESLYRSVRELARPEELPPLDVTSRPVQVKDIWGLYPKDASSRLYAIGIHVGIFALLMFGVTNPAVQTAVKQKMTLIDPIVSPFLPEAKPKVNLSQGGGGGGAREPLPVSKGQAPKPSMKQFVPPQMVDRRPLPAMNPTIIAPPDTPMPVSTLDNWGDPLARLVNGSNGNGFGGGMGSGSGGGLGPGNGGGLGPGNGGGAGGGIFRAGGGVTSPVVISKVDPEYSEEARKAKYSGTVMLSVIVDTEGHARDIRVNKSLGMGLDEKAIEAVQKWRFRPGMNKGVAVNVRALIEVNFRLL